MGVAASSSLEPLKVPCFTLIDALQGTHPSRALEAMFLTAALTAQSAGMDGHELLARAHRQIADADAGRNPHFEAIRDYASGELRKA
ncbi:hypothetical protein [Sphingomonas sp.]|uniref:hypothetical protein n=1 Tax=Sphingomonas sp. TaxID=28214 RepID=UPI002ED8E0D0